MQGKIHRSTVARCTLATLVLSFLAGLSCSRSGSGAEETFDGDGDGDGSPLSAGGSTGADGAGGTPSAVAVCDPEREDLAELGEVTGTCPPGPGEISFETAELCVTLDEESQTLTSLRPKADLGFDFSPSDRLESRDGDGFVHLGDLNLRVREVGQTTWRDASSSEQRLPVTPLSPGGALAIADLSPTFPEMPLRVTRKWSTEGGRLVLGFSLENVSNNEVEVGGLGVPMVFNNIISDRSLEEAHDRCSFSDPYIGNDAGYLQVTRLDGSGPALLVLPERGTALEAYGELLNLPEEDSSDPDPVFFDLTPRNQTFEGFHQWMVHSGAYAEKEWANVDPWNAPTSTVLKPGESRNYGFRFVLADSVRGIEDTLVREQRPLAVGIPGYILPRDVEGRLFLRYPSAVRSMTVEPPGALDIVELSSTENCYRSFVVTGTSWGRARLTVDYEDGLSQTIHYTVTDPAQEVVENLGDFLTTRAWFEDEDDPFGRSPSVMTYDREEDAVVTQAKQAWVCGLGDDGGATWLAGIMKLWGQPDAQQIAQYERFVDEVVWGGLQYDEGPLMHGVKRTLFYYEPGELPPGYYDPNIDWTTWMAWPRAHTEQVPRSYNYPHVAALYWTLYRLARSSTDLVTHHPWDWYLNQAYETTVAMTTVGNQYAEFGLMDGSVFYEILLDLQREGWTQEAADVEARMKERADHWATLDFPFGSEMAWDSTGQEEVYVWSKYFGNSEKADVTLGAILGYMPTVPHWGYNGSARRYWDFIYGGAKIDRLERMLHHYGSSLNALPVLSEYRDHPDDLHLLRIGYGGMMGPLSNIDEEGFPSMAFHSFADTLSWDARTGDYGLAFYGHAMNAATYVVEHPEFGFVSFGGNVRVEESVVTVTPLDAFRMRVYIAPVGLWLTLDSGKFEELSFDVDSGEVVVQLSPADAATSTARLRVENPGSEIEYGPDAAFPVERGAHTIALYPEGVTTVTLLRQ